jgi:hypothetical protein
MLRTIGFIVLGLVAASLGFLPVSTPCVPSTLGVPFVAQIGNNWCWAACMEMMTRYMNSKDPGVPIVSQCQAVSLSLKDPSMPCPMTVPVPSQYDVQGIPFSPSCDPRFRYTPYMGPAFTNYAIPYDSLCAAFDAGRPVIFSWMWEGITKETNANTGAHYMLAEGCPTSVYSSDAFVSVHDPLPAGLGHHRIMRYDEFANISLNTVQNSTSKLYNPKCIFNEHAGDLTNIQYIGK